MRFRSLFLIPIAIMASAATAARSPQVALNELLSAERTFSKAAAAAAPADGIAAMFADDVVLIARGGPVRGREAALSSLSSNPANRGTGATWHSIRSGVSADGQHGFTMGYLDLIGGDAALAHRRYIAYWVRGSNGWRIAAFKQAIRSANETEAKDQGSIVPAANAAAAVAKADYVGSLIAAEQAFSDRAQKVGLNQAFNEFGRQDAMHLSGKGGFAIGRAAIAANVGDPAEHNSPVHWAAQSAIAAPSGDLGVTIGTITPNQKPPEGQPAEIPYFTIWQRDSVDQPWRYVAE